MSEQVSVKLSEEEWDIVIHALEEEIDQLAPVDDNWLGYAPGEEDAVNIATVLDEIFSQISEEAER